MPQSFEQDFNPVVVADLGIELHRREAMARSVPPPAATLRYGNGPRQLIDVYRPPAAATGACLVYFHGGYWCSGGAAGSSFVAGPFLAAGVTVAIVGYDLCPDVTVSAIVDQARAARDFVLDSARQFAIDVGRILIGGSSAGAHLCAMLLQDGPSAWPKSPVAALVTGVYDLEPVLGISINSTLGLAAADVEPLSPLRRTGSMCCRQLLVAVGGGEPAPWQAMSSAFAARATSEGIPTEYLVCDGEDHFAVTTSIGRYDHELTRKSIALLAPRS